MLGKIVRTAIAPIFDQLVELAPSAVQQLRVAQAAQAHALAADVLCHGFAQRAAQLTEGVLNDAVGATIGGAIAPRLHALYFEEQRALLRASAQQSTLAADRWASELRRATADVTSGFATLRSQQRAVLRCAHHAEDLLDAHQQESETAAGGALHKIMLDPDAAIGAAIGAPPSRLPSALQLRLTATALQATVAACEALGLLERGPAAPAARRVHARAARRHRPQLGRRPRAPLPLWSRRRPPRRSPAQRWLLGRRRGGSEADLVALTGDGALSSALRRRQPTQPPARARSAAEDVALDAALGLDGAPPLLIVPLLPSLADDADLAAPADASEALGVLVASSASGARLAAADRQLLLALAPAAAQMLEAGPPARPPPPRRRRRRPRSRRRGARRRQATRCTARSRFDTELRSRVFSSVGDARDASARRRRRRGALGELGHPPPLVA